MKKFIGVILGFVMAFSVVGFAGCNSSQTQGYIDTIAELKEQLKNSGADEVIALKNRVADLESMIHSTTNGNAALKTQLDALNAAVTALSAQLSAKDTQLLDKIKELEEIVKDKESGNAALKAKITELEEKLGSGGTYDDTELRSLIAGLRTDLTLSQTEVAGLKDRITVLETTIGNDNPGLIKQLADLTQLVNETKSALDTANDKILKLQTDVAGFETRIAMLESLQNGTAEQHIYTVCEDAAEGQPAADNTFTFVNNGIKLFSVKLISYTRDGNDRDLHIKITNYTIPNTMVLSSYFNVFTYNVNTNTYNMQNHTLIHDYPVDNNKYLYLHFTPGDKTATHIIVGLPISKGTNEIDTILPYATFKLPSET